MKKNLIVLSAPSGTGKSTICRGILNRRPQWQLSVSYTTRSRRDSEKEGVDYYFISDEEFKRTVKDEEFVEYETVHGHQYGTPKSNIDSALEEGYILFLVVDVKGGLSIKKAFSGETKTIFINPPSVEELERRLRERGSDSEEWIKKRLKRMVMEMSYAKQYDHTVVNIHLDQTVKEIIQLVENHQEGEKKWQSKPYHLERLKK